MMGPLLNRKAQNLIEYTLVIAIIAMAASAMSTYVFRAVQAKQKEISAEAQKE